MLIARIQPQIVGHEAAGPECHLNQRVSAADDVDARLIAKRGWEDRQCGRDRSRALRLGRIKPRQGTGQKGRRNEVEQDKKPHTMHQSGPLHQTTEAGHQLPQETLPKVEVEN